MKKKILFPVLTLVLLLSLTFPAIPVMGGTIYDITLSISASPTQVNPGENTQLIIKLQHEGPITHVLGPVSLSILGYTLTPAPGVYNWNCVAGNSDGYLENGEIWTWQVDSPAINVDTEFEVTGEGDLGYGVCHWADSASVMVTVIPTPPSDFEGLTPGYWKNHIEDWTNYDPTDDFHAVFGVGPNLTLLEALNKGGGGEIALGRHAVAALLNAAHPNIDYPLTVNEIITAVQQAYASGGFESVKDTLESYNELEGDINN